MKQIILNADDFGRHKLINSAVKKSVETGALRSATLMATGAAFDDAINIMKSEKELGVGIHLTLVDDTPLSPIKTIPTLVREDGNFYPNYVSFLKAYLTGKISREDIKTELAAQFEKISRTGLKFTHIDSHQHLHHVPGILQIALELAKKSKIFKMRISHTPLFSGDSTDIKQFIGRLGLFSLATYAKIIGKQNGFIYPNNFTGIVAGGAVNEEFLTNEIYDLNSGVTEVMMHPAEDNETISKVSNWNHDFIAEFKAASSKRLVNFLRENNIGIVNYTSLQR